MKEYEAKVTLKVPEGYEWIGVIRCPRAGELYLTRWTQIKGAEVRESRFNFTEEQYPILRKCDIWKPLTPDMVLDCFVNRKNIQVRHASSKVSLHEDVIRDIYYSASDFLCIRAKLEGEQITRQFLPKELEYLETSK
jgi:hypothetical protein